MFKKFIKSFNLPLRFWVIALIAFINSVSFTIIIPILYPYAKELGLTDFEASLLTTAYAISQFLATPILGRLSDAWGRKPLLIASLIGTVVANLISSVATVAWVLFAARILDGLTGGNNSIANAIISDSTEPQERPKAFGLFDAAFRSGFVTGPAISYGAQLLPPLPGVSPLGMSFAAAALIALVSVVLTWVILPETLPAQKRSSVSWGWGMFGLDKMVTGLVQVPLGNVFTLTLLSGITFTVFTFGFQPFFLEVLNQDAKGLAILFTVFGVLGIMAQIFFVGPLTRRFNLVQLLCAAIAARSLIFLLIPTLPTLPVFVLLICSLSLTNAFPMPILTTLISLKSDPQKQGEMMGLNASYLSMSNAIGPMVSGWLVGFGYGVPFWVAGVMAALTATYGLRLRSLLRD
ncbi:MFS transporter [Prochlorothrix hollandica]|uniref:Multidrug transporter n=1 Tax=Prochlorothrix hollandica PCC 9006 = CALU 1027 TaxID=317619 RepID=A0A0M2Q220_PROHO|nr:MFS transporter [Prochlorothrix hollandica]KKJ01308.1 multidrug transporter [Prochlorothrix hollandica PCC 9006 = CALU 1027]